MSNRSPSFVARAFTQAQLAATLNVPQSQISRIEHQTDLYISTLARYLEAMGGHLDLIAVFGDRRTPLSLADLTDSTSDLESDDERAEIGAAAPHE